MARPPIRLPAWILLTGGDESEAACLALAEAAKTQWLIFRHYHHPAREKLAARLAEACRCHQTRLLIAGDAGLAWRVRAHGVHYPAHQLAGRGLIRRPRPDWLISSAVHSLGEIRAALRCGADAGLLAPVFAAPSGGKLIHPVRFAATARAAPLPLFALGGMDEKKFARLAAAGAKGWAGVRAGRSRAKRFLPAE